MTTDPAALVASLTRLVMAADRAHDDTDRELAAAMLDLDASHRREADLAAELMQARQRIAELEQVIAGQQHAAGRAHQAYLALAAEVALLRAERMGGLVMLVPAVPVGGWRN